MNAAELLHTSYIAPMGIRATTLVPRAAPLTSTMSEVEANHHWTAGFDEAPCTVTRDQ